MRICIKALFRLPTAAALMPSRSASAAIPSWKDGKRRGARRPVRKTEKGVPWLLSWR